MTTFQNPLVIGVFQDEAGAKQALAELNNAGFAKDQLGFANTGSEATSTNLGSELMKLGVPQEHAGYYHNAYQAGQHVVSVRADGREQDAARILSQYGATGINSDPNAGAAMPNNASQMAAYNTYTDPSQNPANQAPGYPTNSADYNNASQQQYNNADQQQYNNAGYNTANQQPYNNADQQFNNPNYNNNADQQQFNNAGYANADQQAQRYNDPNQGFNQAQNYDPNAYQANDANVEQRRRSEREEREYREQQRENNDFRNNNRG
ncbi:hypothetical protein [Dictyobacter kobayashii]|uniref:General stress protein 17M-like domain-containing protein n=1 Tax=Dictyobacter kobayashii TaxID=2014872 RepID=A0A402AIE9_9CHLR|nr:hypothetical protein [Dictyobacter kobayashii]GCE18824.1 hypothetical protein KDK_26240 [Dictyobacter kobayashii]